VAPRAWAGLTRQALARGGLRLFAGCEATGANDHARFVTARAIPAVWTRVGLLETARDGGDADRNQQAIGRIFGSGIDRHLQQATRSAVGPRFEARVVTLATERQAAANAFLIDATEAWLAIRGREARTVDLVLPGRSVVGDDSVLHACDAAAFDWNGRIWSARCAGVRRAAVCVTAHSPFTGSPALAGHASGTAALASRTGALPTVTGRSRCSRSGLSTLPANASNARWRHGPAIAGGARGTVGRALRHAAERAEARDAAAGVLIRYRRIQLHGWQAALVG